MNIRYKFIAKPPLFPAFAVRLRTPRPRQARTSFQPIHGHTTALEKKGATCLHHSVLSPFLRSLFCTSILPTLWERENRSKYISDEQDSGCWTPSCAVYRPSSGCPTRWKQVSHRTWNIGSSPLLSVVSSCPWSAESVYRSTSSEEPRPCQNRGGPDHNFCSFTGCSTRCRSWCRSVGSP